MAELKLSAIWEIADFAEQNSVAKTSPDEYLFRSEEFADLRHPSRPGLTWWARLHSSPVETPDCQVGYFGLWLFAEFDQAIEPAAQHVWARLTATLLDRNGEDGVKFTAPPREFTQYFGSGHHGAFTHAVVENVVRKNGSLRMRIDVRILNIGQLLKRRNDPGQSLACRSLVSIKVGAENFMLPKSVLADQSPVFADLFQHNPDVLAGKILHLHDIEPAVFKAFIQAMLCSSKHNEFLCDVELTKAVLALTVKFKTKRLLRQCDKALAANVNRENALDFLLNVAVLNDAPKLTKACTDLLASNVDFKVTEQWNDFKKSNSEAALLIYDAITGRLLAINNALERRCAKQESTVTDLQAQLTERDNKLTIAASVETQRSQDYERLQGDVELLLCRITYLESQNEQKSANVLALQNQVHRQKEELLRAKAVEATLRREVEFLERNRHGLNMLVAELQRPMPLEECPVCLQPFARDRPKIALVACGHLYCMPCATVFTKGGQNRRPLYQAPVCPICKASITDIVRIFSN